MDPQTVGACSDLQAAVTQFLLAGATLVGVVAAGMKAAAAARDAKQVRKIAENGSGASGAYDGGERRFLRRRASDRDAASPDLP